MIEIDDDREPTDERKEDVPFNGESVLLRALLIPTISCSEKFTSVDYIINKLIDNVPEMIIHKNKYQNKITGKVYSSITPLHVAILKEDTKLLYRAGHMLTKKGDKLEHVIDKINGIDANEEKYQNTLMMAGTPLGVATLTCNVEIFCLILSHFHSELTVVNEKGDNIVHSLIKCTHRNPDPLYKEKSKSMLNFILNMKWRECIKGKPGAAKEETRLLLMMKNEEKLTPLQLAAKREQNELFEIILHHEVYCLKDSVDCTHNVKYDITEIETLALEAEDSNDKHEQLQTGRHESILEYVALQDTESAFRFADFLPVRKVIRAKWQYYRYLFYGWFAFHLVFISLLTAVALRRSEQVSAPDNSANSTTDKAIFRYIVNEDMFVTTVGAFSVFLGCVVIIWMLVRFIAIRRFEAKASPKVLRNFLIRWAMPYSNLAFEFYFFLLSICLILDFSLASSSVDWYENYFLIVAVIVGWYLVLFFLQSLKPFSFFTVLIQKVILDLMRFSFVMSIFLVAFSTAMSMIMQGADTTDDDFEHFGKSIVKMLTVLLGIGEMDIFFQARQPILALLVFVLFVLLSTILLLNALIALMSNSCTDLMRSQGGVVASKMHSRLQKLSVILFLESYLPRFCCKEVGEKKDKYRYTEGRWRPRRILTNVYSKKENVTFFSRTSPASLWRQWFGKHKMNKTEKTLDISQLEGQICDKCGQVDIVHIETEVVRLNEAEGNTRKLKVCQKCAKSFR